MRLCMHSFFLLCWSGCYDSYNIYCCVGQVGYIVCCYADAITLCMCMLSWMRILINLLFGTYQCVCDAQSFLLRWSGWTVALSRPTTQQIVSLIAYVFCIHDLLALCQTILCCDVSKMFSNDILAEWERETKILVSSKTLKAPDMAKLLKKCGLGCSKVNVSTRRTMLESCRRHKLPVDKQMVIDSLVNEHNERISGS